MSPDISTRTDLLHLSPEALTQLTNAGLVKRAVREFENGYVPELKLEEDATLSALFADGVACVWPRGTPIAQSKCTCGATSVCRHRLIAALHFRGQFATQAIEGTAAQTATASVSSAATDARKFDLTLESPAATTDEAIAALVPPSLLGIATQQAEQGITIEVRRIAAGEPCDTARLPAATVRFWAGSAIEAARCDCVRASACEHIVLGAWAFRKAAISAVQEPITQVRLGGIGQTSQIDRAPYLAVMQSIMLRGTANGINAHTQVFSMAFDAAHHDKADWISQNLHAIENWGAAYAARSARYDPTKGVDLVTELALRMKVGALPGNAKAVLGIGQPHEVALDRLRLMCLGARTERDGELRRTRIVLADVDTGTRMSLSHEWQVLSDHLADEASIRAAERVAPGVRLEQLAQGQLLSQQAKRKADGTIQLARARSNQNSLLPQSGDWSMLGAPLRFSRVEQLKVEKRNNPHDYVLPRHAATQFVVFSPTSIGAAFYDPNAQMIVLDVQDSQGETLRIRRTHESHIRNALDALADAALGRCGTLKHVAGVLSWEHGIPVIDPWALVCDALIVPDFSQSKDALFALPLGYAGDGERDLIAIVLAQLRENVSVMLHHGLADLPSTWFGNMLQSAQQMRALSLSALAASVVSFVAQTKIQAAAHDLEAAQTLAKQLATLICLRQLHEDAHVLINFAR